jgi:hypothetical protein
MDIDWVIVDRVKAGERVADLTTDERRHCKRCGRQRRLVINKPSERQEAERRPCMACAKNHRRQGKAT